MFRGTTARTALALLAATLLALQFFAPGTSFASAHTTRQAEAKAQPGSEPSGKAPRDETASHGHCDPAGDPTGPLRTRDRHRAADHTPQRPERSAQPQDPVEARTQVPTGACRRSRPPAAHSPAALQVFRC